MRSKDKSILFKSGDLLEQVADIYISICYEELKDISLTGFSYMTGISRNALNAARISSTPVYIDIDNRNKEIPNKSINGYRKAYPKHEIVELPKQSITIVVEKIATASEQALTSLALDGSVMSLAIGKIKHGWIEGGLQQKQAEMLEDARNASDLLREYKRNALPGNDSINI